MNIETLRMTPVSPRGHEREPAGRRQRPQRLDRGPDPAPDDDQQGKERDPQVGPPGREGHAVDPRSAPNRAAVRASRTATPRRARTAVPSRRIGRGPWRPMVPAASFREPGDPRGSGRPRLPRTPLRARRRSRPGPIDPTSVGPRSAIAPTTPAQPPTSTPAMPPPTSAISRGPTDTTSVGSPAWRRQRMTSGRRTTVPAAIRTMPASAIHSPGASWPLPPRRSHARSSATAARSR